MNKTLFELLVEVEKLGYIILTYEEAREVLRIEPLENDEIFTTYRYFFKRYFLFNNNVQPEKIKSYLKIFLKKCKPKNNIVKLTKRKVL